MATATRQAPDPVTSTAAAPAFVDPEVANAQTLLRALQRALGNSGLSRGLRDLRRGLGPRAEEIVEEGFGDLDGGAATFT